MASPSSSSVDQVLKLRSQDGVEFTVSYNAVIHSKTLRDLLEATADSPSDDPIPVPIVDGDILQKVVEWCEHYKDKSPSQFIEEEKANIDAKCDIPEWDMDFLMTLDIDMMVRLLNAANYLDIGGLLNTACKKVGGEIKGQSPEFVREYFNIVNDYTPEEEARLREENSWAEEPLKKEQTSEQEGTATSSMPPDVPPSTS